MRLLLILLLSSVPVFGAVRTWRSADGLRSFDAEFISSDGARVTLKRASDNRILTFTAEKLHPDDRAWLKTQVKPSKGTPQKEEPIPEGAAFDTLEFGDDRKTVEEKLKKSSQLIPTVSETLFGRTGLNGVYKTKATIGGLHCFLYFDWSKSGRLREITLQTQAIAKEAYRTSLRSNWEELIELLGILHGKPIQEAPYPKSSELQDGLLLGSHLWYTEDSHSVILCTGQEREKYMVAVRITSEHIVPVKTNDTPPSGQRVAPR